jgi:hypothetical protein
MKRRDFIRLVGGSVAVGVADVVAVGVAPDIAPMEEFSDNWWAFREVLKSYAPVVDLSLEVEKDGYRLTHITTREAVHHFRQPWSRRAHSKDNLNYNLLACDCGAKTLTQHSRDCRHATHLAWKLGPELDGFHD